MTARTALVTGGAGFIGSHLVERLESEGFGVRVLDDLSSGREENLAGCGDRVELVRGDVRDREALARCAAGAERVFHLAAIASVPQSVADPLGSDAVNVGGTLRVLEAARAAGSKRVVFAASAAVYGDGPELPERESLPPAPLSPYALQKYAGEQYCRYYDGRDGLETVSLRYFNVYGPRQDPSSPYSGVISRLAEACLAGKRPRIFGDGEQTRDFVYVADVVEASWRAAFAPDAAGRAINVAGGARTSVSRLLEAIQDAVGSDLCPIHEAAREGDVRHSLADLTLAARILGYAPAIPLAVGIRRTVDSLRGVES